LILIQLGKTFSGLAITAKWFGILNGNMKKLILFCLLLSSCAREPISVSSSDNPEFKVSFLFEKDGIKVYRFYDAGRFIYYTDARGHTEWKEGDKTEYKNRVETVR